MIHSAHKKVLDRRHQKGAITMFSAILILILLTEMIIYAVHVGVFEQRKSSNELIQKEAFHVADAAIQQAKQFFAANTARITSAEWLDARWAECPDSPAATHPCAAEPVAAFRGGTYFYSFDDGTGIALPDAANPSALSDSLDASFDADYFGDKQVQLHALLCVIDGAAINNPGVPICSRDIVDSPYFMITLMAHGEADCTESAGDVNCNGEALIVDKIGSFGPGGQKGGPGVPLTARTAVPLSGTVNIVPNPNGGGLGVPISSWVNARQDGACALEEEAISTESASYETCELHEWYGMDDYPEDYLCPGDKTPCRCKRGEDRLLSYTETGNERILNFDVVPDENFPCDLFAYTFGIDKANYKAVKDLVPPSNRLTDCSSLDENSEGWYWVSGPECDIPPQVGSANSITGESNVVFLVSATKFTKANAQVNFFGVLFVTDAEYGDKGYTCTDQSKCGFGGNGGATVFGAAVMDAEMRHFRGNFSVVYIDFLVNRAQAIGGVGTVAGGWTDFPPQWRPE